MPLSRTNPDATATPRPPRFLLLPSLGCQSACVYCFGPRRGPIMSPATLHDTLAFMEHIADETGAAHVDVTFHGGEPLLAGHDLIRRSIEGMESWGKPLKLGVQSNLWLLDDAFCDLFRRHSVEIGTSLDGPQHVTDSQRGPGYFDRTMAGIRRARAQGLSVGCIATFTAAAVEEGERVVEFFLRERLDFSVHAATPPLEGETPAWALAPETYAALLREMLHVYLPRRRDVAIGSLDQIARGVASGEGRVCTFRDCLGMFLAIDAKGDVYPCQRFCGRPEHRLGNVSTRPTWAALMDSPAARRMAARERAVRERCASCEYLSQCKGGCPFNAWAGGQNDRVRDPYCEAYRSTFAHIRGKLLEEMGSEDNVEAIASHPLTERGHPLLRRGPLIDIARGDAHPRDVARTARRIVAAVELARGPDLPSVAARLVARQVCRSVESAEASLEALRVTLHPPSAARNSLYAHVTLACPLRCTHCYADAGTRSPAAAEMPVPALVRLLREASDVRFRKVVITGGEPLAHSDRDGLLRAIADERARCRGTRVALRTSLASPLEGHTLLLLASAADELVVSIDGDQNTHDARRGRGSYDATVRNLEAYQAAARQTPGAAEVSLCAVLPAVDANGSPGDAARALGRQLGVRRLRFRPVLPLGRAADWADPPVLDAHAGRDAPVDSLSTIEAGFRPIAGCGLGQNLSVQPSGQCFPCHACETPEMSLGSVFDSGLAAVLDSVRFRGLAGLGVDGTEGCRECDLRYLCGGVCRAWTKSAAASAVCAPLRQNAAALLAAAMRYLEL